MCGAGCVAEMIAMQVALATACRSVFIVKSSSSSKAPAAAWAPSIKGDAGGLLNVSRHGVAVFPVNDFC